jgi:hypothetical protein
MITTVINAPASRIKSQKQNTKLSKAAKWKRKHPEGVITILDMKAVMK